MLAAKSRLNRMAPAARQSSKRLGLDAESCSRAVQARRANPD